MDTDAIQHALSGPIASIRTPFQRDGSIDYASLQAAVDFDINAGSGALLLTWGDSLFSLLSDSDIADVTRAVIDCAAGRAAVVACTGRWWTSQAVEFATFCQGAGADILQVFLPLWYPGASTGEAIVAHHAALAGVLPIMANSGELRRNGEAVGLSVAATLRDQVPGVVAMKADCEGDFDRRLTALLADGWAVFAGGKKAFHLELWPYGCRGYLSTFVTFRPEVTHAYWQAIGSGDQAAAVHIIDDIDRPFFDHIIAAPGGFDAALHGILELTGVGQRWRRAPFYSLNDRELEELSDFLDGLPSPPTS